MGRALARMMAARGDQLFVLGRNVDDLARSIRDLEAHAGGGEISHAYCDLTDPSSFVPALDRANEALGGFDTVVLTAGLFATQEQLETDPELCRRMLIVNHAHSVVFLEQARRRLLERGGGTICAFSSVAGDRARKPVVLYGSAKGGLSYYLEGLDHRFRAHGLRVVCVKPGFVKTGMTAGLKAPPFAGEPDDVARVVLRAIDSGRSVVYAPPVWRWIMAVIRQLPRSVMRKVSF
jgi:NAD(P)-dependent dehydrogenase (short-subunit alcohol dehydrogenase family)